jgi:hypothetical protein
MIKYQCKNISFGKTKQLHLQYAFLLLLIPFSLVLIADSELSPATGNYTLQTFFISHQPKNKLPLILIAFSGSPDKDIIRLQWRTTAENNINRFELE